MEGGETGGVEGGKRYGVTAITWRHEEGLGDETEDQEKGRVV